MESTKFLAPELPTSTKVDPARNRFPYCVVWTPIPFITWLFPFIGHTGICSSAGVIYDFAGPYYISEDNMAFGKPTKYWQLSNAGVHLGDWDAAVLQGSKEYSKRMHNLFCDNCHSHVARCLNLMQYRGYLNWNMFKVGFMLALFGKYVSFGGFVKTYLPFLIMVGIAVVVVTTVKS